MRKDIIQSKTEPNKNNIWLSEEGLKKYGKNGWELLGGSCISPNTPIANDITGEELIPVNQNGENKAVTVEQIKDNVLAIPSKYEFVDLGLPSGTKWATCNIGANSPEEAGLYFAWGETEGYSNVTDTKKFSWDDYKLCNGSNTTLTKYNNDNSCGTVDNLLTLEQVDDAAYHSDSTCRIPTATEIYELGENTIATWETLNGVNGRRLTSKINGNSIFIPAAGYCYNGSVLNVDSIGYLWSITLNSGYPKNSWSLNFNAQAMGIFDLFRCYGLPIRPIQSANTKTKVDLVEIHNDVETIKNEFKLPSKYEFVDLGLPSGLKWATTNVGAEKPEDVGLYFAWAETQGYTAEDVTNKVKLFNSNYTDYKYCEGSSTSLTKYNNTETKGIVDNLNQLLLEDDAAYISDNKCRIPTKEECEELINNTYYYRETLNGVAGAKIISKINGNSIFIPYGGTYSNGTKFENNSSARIMTSSLTDNPNANYELYIYSDSAFRITEYGIRPTGKNIRPVQPSDVDTTINLKELQDKVDNITPYVTFDYTQYSDGDTLSDEDAAKLSKAFTEKIPIYIVTSWDEVRYGTTVMDAIGNHYTLLFLMYIIDNGINNGLSIKFGQIDFDMNTNTISIKQINLQDYFVSRIYKPYFYRGTINEEIFNEIKSAANYGCNIMWNYKRLNVTRVTNDAVYGFIDDGDSITKYEFTKTAVNTLETKQYSFT